MTEHNCTGYVGSEAKGWHIKGCPLVTPETEAVSAFAFQMGGETYYTVEDEQGVFRSDENGFLRRVE